MFMLNSGFLELCKLHYLVYGSRESVYYMQSISRCETLVNYST